jgi:hypothetical protein
VRNDSSQGIRDARQPLIADGSGSIPGVSLSSSTQQTFSAVRCLHHGLRIQCRNEICDYLRSLCLVPWGSSPGLEAAPFAQCKIETTAAAWWRATGVPQSCVDSIVGDNALDLCKETSGLQGVATTLENRITDVPSSFFHPPADRLVRNSDNACPISGR